MISHRKLKTVYDQNLAPYLTITDDQHRERPVNCLRYTKSNASELISNSKLLPSVKLISTDADRCQIARQSRWDMNIGVRGNLCNRARLRRQY